MKLLNNMHLRAGDLFRFSLQLFNPFWGQQVKRNFMNLYLKEKKDKKSICYLVNRNDG